MNAVFRAAAMYFFLLLVFRLSGKRTLGEATTFDLLMLLVISETTQQAMIDSDNSFTQAVVLITTFLTLNVGMSLLKQRFPRVESILEGNPVILVDHGVALRDRLDRCRVDEEDVLEAARHQQGLERLDQIKFAVLERNGKISIIPSGDQ